MADPVTVEQAIADLVDAWRVTRRFRHPEAPEDWAPAVPPRSREDLRAVEPDPPPLDALHPLHDPRWQARALRELRSYSMNLGADRPATGRDLGPEPAPEDLPAAWPELTAVRDGLARFQAHPLWRWHPLAKRMAGSFAGTGITNPDLADLGALPESPAERAAVLTASAMTARQERDRLGSMVEGAQARTAKRVRALADANAEHYAAAVAMLPDALGAWWSVVEVGIGVRPQVPAYPTVPATAYGYAALGRA